MIVDDSMIRGPISGRITFELNRAVARRLLSEGVGVTDEVEYYNFLVSGHVDRSARQFL